MLLDKLKNTESPFFGHQRAVDASGKYPLEDVINQKPAVVGFPLNDIFKTPPKGRPSPAQKFTEVLKTAYNLGQIIELDWHYSHPDFRGTKIDKNGGGYKHDKGNPDKRIETCLKSKLFYKDLDVIADFILGLEAKGVELLFRPFHEMNLNCFWWGRIYNTPEDYKKLYQTVVNYLRNKGCKCHFVFAPNRHPKLLKEYLDYYPGDEYVDVCGFDFYYPIPDRFTKIAEFLNSFVRDHSKILAFTECGPRLGGFQKLKPDQKQQYFPSLLRFLNSADFKYVRFWSITPSDPDDNEGSYVPTEEPELTYFKEQFLPHVKLL